MIGAGGVPVSGGDPGQRVFADTSAGGDDEGPPSLARVPSGRWKSTEMRAIASAFASSGPCQVTSGSAGSRDQPVRVRGPPVDPRGGPAIGRVAPYDPRPGGGEPVVDHGQEPVGRYGPGVGVEGGGHVDVEPDTGRGEDPPGGVPLIGRGGVHQRIVDGEQAHGVSPSGAVAAWCSRAAVTAASRSSTLEQ